MRSTSMLLAGPPNGDSRRAAASRTSSLMRRTLTAILVAASATAVTAPAMAANSPIVTATHAVVTLQAGQKQGTAFAFRRRGLLLTNAHVVGDVRRVVVVTSGGHRASGS